MKKKISKITFVLAMLFLMCSISKVQAKSNGEEHYSKTGYFTKLYIREHVSDMPREYFMLVGEDATLTPIWFHRYSSKNKGEFSINTFDPKKYLGKVISIDFTGSHMNNNQEFPVFKDGNLKLIPRVTVSVIHSLEVLGKTFSVDKKYKYPQKDTLMITHDVLVKKESYSDQSLLGQINLKSFVHGEGTEESPFVSDDGTAGLKDAIKNLAGGGTINVVPGVYKITSKKINIPRFVSIKGVENKVPEFVFTSGDVWFLQGNNTLDNIKVSFGTIDERYCGQLIVVDNNAKDVFIKKSEFLGAYSVDEGTYKEHRNAVCFRLMSHLENIVFDGCSFKNILRGISTKGQRDQNGLIIKRCLFEGSNSMCITLDQVSNIRNVVIEDNTFKNFSHFGIAFARINDVKLRNNIFYSRNLLSYNTYNMAIHIEEHCQNFVIENNIIDTYLRLSDKLSDDARCLGISVTESRNMLIKNNHILNANISFRGREENLDYCQILNNKIENAGISISGCYNNVTIRGNEIIKPAKTAITLFASPFLGYSFGGHVIDSNVVTELNGKQALSFNGKIFNTVISNNTFEGGDQKSNTVSLDKDSKNIKFENNTGL